MAKSNQATVLAPVSNDGGKIISFSEPYVVQAEIVGTSPFLFHRWSVEGVEEKARASKGSKAKKTDDTESYVYRDSKGNLAIPSEYFRMSIIGAAKFKQDPRSPRKSAMDIFKAGIIALDEYCSLGVKDWDYLDRRRVVIQKSAITRSRPAMQIGWRIKVRLECVLPEYISDQLLNEVFQSAGRLVGVGDFRPSFGRFQVVKFVVE